MSTLSLQFVNNSGVDTSDVSVGFLVGPGAVAPQIVNNATGKAIAGLQTSDSFPQAGNWIPLADLSEGVTITAFSGRVYVCYGQPWAIQTDGYEPGQTPSDPNFFLRYDKFEMTFTGGDFDVANLTSIDYWSIPMTLETSLQGKPSGRATGLRGNTTFADIQAALDALTNPPVSGLPPIPNAGPDGTALRALVSGDFVQLGDGPAPPGGFQRYIGPSAYASIFPIQGIPVQPYDLLKDYMAFLIREFGPKTSVGAVVPGLGNGVIANIAGEFVGVGLNPPKTGPQAKQTYDLSATIDANSNITLKGTLSVEGATTMEYAVDDLLNPTGIYGGNAPFTLNGGDVTPPGNDVYGWIGGDLFSGFAVGALGSATEIGGQVVGAMRSQDWFANLAPDDFFANLQPNGPYYNPWSAALQPLSDAYNFAFTDRFAPVFVPLDPGSTDAMTVTLESAT